MREGLRGRLGQRLRFTAEVGGYGSRHIVGSVWRLTLLLRDVRLAASNERVSDHVWVTEDRAWAAREWHHGDLVAFTARVRPYTRVYGPPTPGPRQYALSRVPSVCLMYCTQIVPLDDRPPRTIPAPPPPVPVPAAVLDAAIAVARETKPSLTGRILTTIATLQMELGRPPGLVRVVIGAAGPPVTIVTTLRRLAERGIVTFTPDGALTLCTDET